MNLIKQYPRLSYSILLGILVIIFCMFFVDYRVHTAMIEKGEKVTVQLYKVVCVGFKYNRNYIVFSRNGANHIVNVGRDACKTYQPGDTVELLYNSKRGLYLPVHYNTQREIWGMMLVGLGILVIVYLLMFRRGKKVF